MSEVSLLIAIPTRNRADLACTSLRSVLSQLAPGVRLWVSDNSTEHAEAERLLAFCQAQGEAVRYLRPPEPLPMGQHWEWIAAQALDDGDISHVAYLTDRMLFKPGALQALLRCCRRFPQNLIAYDHDHIDDFGIPVRLEQTPWTGRVLEVESVQFIRHALRIGWTNTLPRMLNCAAPRDTLLAIRQFYGSIMDAISPDVSFGMRCLERFDSFLFMDRTLMVDYAMTRSNGTNAHRGIAVKDAVDFLSQLGARGHNYAAPIPGLPTVTNAVYHEYALVREFSRSPKLPPISLAQYARLIGRELRKLGNTPARQQMQQRFDRQLLAWRQTPEFRIDRIKQSWLRASAVLTPRYLYRRLVKLLGAALPERPRLLWKTLSRGFGIQPPCMLRRLTEHADAAAALDYACHRPLARRWGPSQAEYRISARLLAIDRDP